MLINYSPETCYDKNSFKNVNYELMFIFKTKTKANNSAEACFIRALFIT